MNIPYMDPMGTFTGKKSIPKFIPIFCIFCPKIYIPFCEVFRIGQRHEQYDQEATQSHDGKIPSVLPTRWAPSRSLEMEPPWRIHGTRTYIYLLLVDCYGKWR